LNININKTEIDIEKPFKVSAGYSNSKGILGKVFFKKEMNFDDTNNLEFDLEIPFNKDFLNSKLINIWADSSNEIDEKNEANNKLTLKIDLRSIKQGNSFIFPNPVKDKLTLFMNNKFNGKVNITINSVNRKSIYRESFYKFNKYFLHKIENIDLPAGVYLIQISYEKEVELFQFIKL
jgi:hypothetical protein